MGLSFASPFSGSESFLEKQANYIVLSPDNWKPSISTREVTYSTGQVQVTDATATVLRIAVDLPDNATVTRVIVNGSDATETWTMVRIKNGGAAEQMATASIGTADTTIAFATIDNENYTYSIFTSLLETNDTLTNGFIQFDRDE